MSSIPAPRPATPRTASPVACHLLLPVGPEVTAHQVTAAIEVARRTLPATVDAAVLLVLDPISEPDPATAAAVDAATRSLRNVRTTTASLAAAASTVESGFVAVVDVPTRPDLGRLSELLLRLERADDPLPFVHRLGVLVTRRERLASLPHSEPGPTHLPALARALRPRSTAPIPQPTLTGDALTPETLTPDTLAAETLVPRPGSISVVVVADAALPVLDPALSRLKQHLPAGAQAVVVDPGGNYGRSAALRTLRWATVVPADADGPAALRSAGIRAAAGEFVVLLDPAAWIVRRTVEGLVSALRSAPDVAAVGPITNLGFGDQQAAGVGYADVDAMERFAEQCRSRSGATVTELTALAAGCVAYRRSALVAVGGHDAAFADPVLADLDLCLRLRQAGGRLLRAEGVFVHLATLPSGTATGRWRFGGGGDLALLRARHGDDADRSLPGLVGAVLIVKNEEESLARALESVSGVVDDVVVCDTGSVDGTLDLLDACGARSTAFAWTDDFAAARNAALAAHTGTWGLLLDADETLECADSGEWRHWLARNTSDVVFLVCRNLESGTGGSTVDNASSRLLRAADCHWAGRIHEQMVRRDGRTASNSASDGARILHDGYAVRRVVDRRKIDRNAALTQRELDAAEAPDQTTETHDPGRAHFERGRAEMLASNKAEAEEHFRLAVDLLPDSAALLRRMACCNLATLANEQGRHAEARDFAELALDRQGAYTQAALALAVAHLALDEPDSRDRARRLLETTILAGGDASSPSIDRLMSSLHDEGLAHGAVAALLGTLLLESSDTARAVELLLPLAQQRPSLFEAWDVLRSALVVEQRDWAELFADAAAAEPGALERLVSGLADPDREQLLTALRRRGVEDWQVSSVERTWQALQPELRRMSAAALVAAARQQESSSPELALRLWRFAGDEPHMQVGQARCLDAMGRQSAAVEALDGLDPSRLEPSDTLFVVALAAELGDGALALALLDGLPADLDESLAAPARAIRAVLSSA